MLNQRPITTIKAFNSVSIEFSGVADSEPIDLREIAQGGYFSVFHTITGSGVLKLEVLVGVEKNGAFVSPPAGGEIATGLVAGSGLVSFSPPLAPFIKIRATETGAVSTAVLTAWVNIQ